MEGVGGGGCIGSVGINSFFSPFPFFYWGKVLEFDYCYLQSLFIYSLLHIYGSPEVNSVVSIS